MFWSPFLVICVIKGDRTSVLWSTNSCRSPFCCKTSLAGPLESEPQFTDCFLCHRTQPLGGSHWNLLWLELVLPKCHVSACCSQKCCLRVSPGGTFTRRACPRSPRAPALCSHLSLRADSSTARWSAAPGGGPFTVATPGRSWQNRCWQCWISEYGIIGIIYTYWLNSIHFSFALPSGMEMDVQFRVYIEAIVWFREDRLGF